MAVMEDRNNQAFKAVLTTKGRKTGCEHSVWLRAVMYEIKFTFQGIGLMEIGFKTQ